MSWVYLLLAGAFEIGFTTCLKMSAGLTRWQPATAFLVFAVLSFWMLTRATETIPLGTAYAVWTGIGAFGTALVGMIWFNEPTGGLRIFFLAALIASVMGLKWVSPH